MNDPSRMEKDRKKMAERIINLTLEIIYLLTGEDYTIVRKLSDTYVTAGILPCVSGGWSPSTAMSPPSKSLIQETSNAQKILQLTNKITELLTGEVPVRCQDVTVYLSMEEWEYLEGHRDQYKEVMMEDQPPLTPQEEYRSNTPESCHTPPYCQHHPEETHRILQDDQEEDLKDIKEEFIVGEEELYMRADGQYEDGDIPTDVCTANYPYTNNVDAECGVTSGERPYPTHEPSVLHSRTLSSNSIKDSGESQKSENFQCSECGKCFKKKFNLVIHKKTHRGDRPFSCSECGKCFTRKSSLVTHERAHTGEKPYSCSECGKCFSKRSILVEHQKSHTGEKPFSCSDCGRGFTHKPNLIIHQRIHTGEKPYFCLECDKCFTRKQYLKSHQKIHTGEKPFPCTECKKCFTQKSALNTHQKVHTREKPFPCSECDKFFTQKSHLLRHQKIHTGKRVFSCSECGKCFTLRSDFTDHLRSHIGEKPYSECGKNFIMKSHLVNHQKTHAQDNLTRAFRPPRAPADGISWQSSSHNQDINMVSPRSESSDVQQELIARFSDNYLDIKLRMDRKKKTERILNLTLEIIYLLTGEDYTVIKKPDKGISPDSYPHVPGKWNDQKILELTSKVIELLTDEVPIRCQDVTVYLSMEEWEYLEGHRDQYKEVMMEDQPPLTPQDIILHQDWSRLSPSTHYKVECDRTQSCYEQCSITPDLPPLLHSRDLSSLSYDPTTLEDPSSHQSQFPFPEHGMDFTKKSHLSMQKTCHKNERKYSCSVCGKCFTNKPNFLEHQRIHTGERPYSCLECGKSFTWRSNLGEHQKVHTGVKPYSCLDCGKCFASKSHLVEHQRIHTGERPFSCSECGKSFAIRSNLVEHQKTHRGERPFSCSQCGKCFTRKPDLVRHQKVHTGEKPFSCMECGKCFSMKSNLVEHQKVHTGERPYTCPECGRCFSKKSNLVEHQKIYAGRSHFHPYRETYKVHGTVEDIVESEETTERETRLGNVISVPEEMSLQGTLETLSIKSLGRAFQRTGAAREKSWSLVTNKFEIYFVPTLSPLFSTIDVLTRRASPLHPFTPLPQSLFTLYTLRPDTAFHLSPRLHIFLLLPSSHVSSSRTPHVRFPRFSHSLCSRVGSRSSSPGACSCLATVRSHCRCVPLLPAPHRRMNKERHKMTERILNLTLEIIYLLTGEDYTVVKKSVECVAPNSQSRVSEGWSKSQIPSVAPPPRSLIHGRINEHKVLELTNKIILILTKEVPIRCQDVTVYLSMEEWEYLEGHKDQYKEVMVEDQPPLTPQDTPSETSTSERCPSPQDGSRGNLNVPQHHQIDDLIIVKVEETEEDGEYNGGDCLYNEDETPTNISTGDDCSRSSEGHFLSYSDCEAEHNITRDPYGDHLIISNLPSVDHNEDPPSDPTTVTEPSSDQSQVPRSFPWSEYREYCRNKLNGPTQKTVPRDEKQFPCPECEKCFSYKSNLYDHLKIHTGEKPYLCSDCGKCFTRKSDLVRHHRTHTGERPYSCPVCSKCFAMKSVLVGHQKTHTGEKPFSCLECGKSFNRKFSLVVHQRIHTGEKPFACSECEKSYTNKKQLVLHQRLHTEGKTLC
ncbi:zinc finger protein 91-like [Dendropsophus ebraccatus]|uniref:zinc finger protein 91-like n=1 Tax=Dendropsophus ebraccatus TaxID=150705 RepID=UPI0038314284